MSVLLGLYYTIMLINLVILAYLINLEKKSMDVPIDCRVVMLRSAEAKVFSILVLGFWAILRQDILLLILFWLTLYQQSIYILGSLILAQVALWFATNKRVLVAWLPKRLLGLQKAHHQHEQPANQKSDNKGKAKKAVKNNMKNATKV